MRDPSVTTGNDGAVYLLLGRALRSFQYTDFYMVGSPIQAQYPPVYPAFLAVLGGLFGERLNLFLAANIVLSVGGLALVFDAAYRMSRGIGLMTLAVAALNPALLGAGTLLSEPLFFALTALGLWAMLRQPRSPVIAGAAAIAAALTRVIGVSLVVATALHWIMERRWRRVGWFSVASVVLVGSWLAWAIAAPTQIPGRSYAADAFLPARSEESSPLPPPPPPAASAPRPPSTATKQPPAPPPWFGAAVAARIRHNVPEYLTRKVPTTLSVLTIPGTSIDNWGWLLLLVACGGVGWVTLLRLWRPAALTLGAYWAILLVWPYAIGRYLLPVLPFIILAVLHGAATVGRVFDRGRRDGRWAMLLPLGLAVALLAGELRGLERDIRRAAACDRLRPNESPGCYTPEQRAFFAATRFIGTATPDDAVFLTAKEGTFYYYARRRVARVVGIPDLGANGLREYLEASGVDYILLSHLKLDERDLVRSLLRLCPDLDLVETWGPATVLLRTRPSGGVPGARRQDACAAIQRYADVPWTWS